MHKTRKSHKQQPPQPPLLMSISRDRWTLHLIKICISNLAYSQTLGSQPLSVSTRMSNVLTADSEPNDKTCCCGFANLSRL